MYRRPRWSWIAIVLLFGAAGCSGNEDSTITTDDAGQGDDATAGRDALRSGSDALPRADASEGEDAGESEDSGEEPFDVGPGVDAVVRDAAPRVDAGPGTDATARMDATIRPDATVRPDAAVRRDAAVQPDAQVPTPANGGVLEHHGNARRDGVYIDPAFTRAAAGRLHRDMGFNAPVTGPVYAQPLYFADGAGGPDLIIVATERNQVLALDANSGATVWQRTLGTPVPLSRLPCGNIDPLGITGTPVIDGDSRTLYLDAMTTPDGGNTKKHLIFALSLDNGSTVPGWPVDVSATVRYNGNSFNSSTQNQRGALTLLNGVVYVTYGGHFGDCGSYRGWVVGVPVDNPGAPSAWASRSTGSGVWAPSGPSTDGTNLFIATGNALSPTSWLDSEAIIRLGPGPVFSQQTAHYFAPSNWVAMDRDDQDLGGTAPVLFDLPGSNPSELTIALTKDGRALLLDRNNLGGVGHQIASRLVSNLGIITAAAAYTTSRGTYVAFHGNCTTGRGDMIALKVNPGSPPSLAAGWCAQINGGPTTAGAPIVTATDEYGNEAIVWMVGAEGDNKLHGINADTGATVFTGGGTAEAMGSVRRFQAPIVMNGRMYVAGNSRIFAFIP